MMRSQLQLAFFSVLLLIVAGNSLAEEQSKPAIQVIEETATSVIDRVNQDKDKLESDPDSVLELVYEMIIPHFDFVSMSKWVLGKKNWSSASEVQQEQFVNEFRDLLVNTYTKALLQYSDNKINYLSEKPSKNPNLVEVLTEVEQDGSGAVPINYRMRNKDGKWQVVDVVVNGASLVRTYRGEFTSQIRKNGMDHLIAKLTERNK